MVEVERRILSPARAWRAHPQVDWQSSPPGHIQYQWRGAIAAVARRWDYAAG
jgi:hypothetical protein